MAGAGSKLLDVRALVGTWTPAVRIALAAGTLVAGEAIGFALNLRGCAWVWTAVACAVAGLVRYGWKGEWPGWGALFALGMVCAMRTDSKLYAILDANAGLDGERPALDLMVEGEVVCRTDRGGRRRFVEFPSHAGPASLRVRASLQEGERVPRVGEVWRVKGGIAPVRDAGRRYGTLNMWVGRERMVGRAGTRGMGGVWSRWSRIGGELARRVGFGLDWNAELAGLNRAILLGRREELDPARKQRFVEAGTIHVFAISGLHVMVVVWVLEAMLGRLDVPQRVRGLVEIPLIWGYVVLTGGRPSAMRAALMVTLWMAGPVLGRRPDLLTAWGVTALLVYGLAPQRCLDLGCALSFSVMLGIVVWLRWTRGFRPWFDPDSRWGRRLGNWMDGLGVSAAAWAAGVPLAAAVFGRISPGGLLANLVVIVCAKLMVRLGVGGLLASFVCGPLTAILNNGAAGCTGLMVWVSEWVSSLPFSSLEVKPWSWGGCVLWYVLCVGVARGVGRFLPRRGLETKRWWK